MAYKIVLGFFLIVAAAYAQTSDSGYTSEYYYTESYVTEVKRQQSYVVEYYDYQIESFEESYMGRIETIDTQQDFLVDSIEQTDNHLYAMGLLSEFSKGCVNKYMPELPSVDETVATVQDCSGTAKNQLDSLIAAPLATRNSLTCYYNSTFEKGLEDCAIKFNSSSQLNYTLCITSVVSDANAYTNSNKKKFSNQLDAAKCFAESNVKTALDCSYTAQSNVMSKIAETNILVNNCIQGSDCSTCTSNYCENVERMSSNMISFKNRTMKNLFYGRKTAVSCLMLEIV